MKRRVATYVTVGVVVVSVCAALAIPAHLASADANRVFGGRSGGFLRHAIANGAMGGDRPGLGGFMMERMHEFMTLRDDLNLTEDQKAQLAELRAAWRETIAPQFESVLEAKDALGDAVMDDASDEETIRAAADALSGVVGDAAVSISYALADARQVLTPEQLEIAQEFRAGRAAKRDDRRGQLREAVSTLRDRMGQ